MPSSARVRARTSGRSTNVLAVTPLTMVRTPVSLWCCSIDVRWTSATATSAVAKREKNRSPAIIRRLGSG